MHKTFLKPSAVAFAAVAVGFIVSAPIAQSVPPASPGAVTNVMVQWLDLAGNHPHTDCTVHIVNRSLTQQITIEQFVVVGPGGRPDVIGASPTIVGMTLAPLAEIRVPINSTTIPGAAPQTAFKTHGVRNAIVRWAGPPEAMHLEAIQERYATGQTDQRTHWVSRGYFAVD